MIAGRVRIHPLRVPAVPDSLDSIHDQVERLWSGLAGVSSTDRLRFETAVVEIAGNIIEHAAPDEGASQVWLTFSEVAGPTSIEGELIDDGRRVDVDLGTVQMPGSQAEDGRGLALVRTLCDEVRYERAQRTNRWTVVCHRGPSEPAPR